MDSLYIAKIRRHESKRGRHFPCVYTNFTENVHITHITRILQKSLFRPETKNPEVAGLQDFALICPFGWWEQRESNPRPSACKADALNQLSYAPVTCFVQSIVRVIKNSPVLFRDCKDRQHFLFCKFFLPFLTKIVGLSAKLFLAYSNSCQFRIIFWPFFA